MLPSTISKISLTAAAIDFIAATVCAASGDPAFLPFMILAGLMYAHGCYFRARANELKE